MKNFNLIADPKVYEREPKELWEDGWCLVEQVKSSEGEELKKKCPGEAVTPDQGGGHKKRGPYYHKIACQITVETVTEP